MLCNFQIDDNSIKISNILLNQNIFDQWQEHLSRKPDPNAMPPGAAEALKEAEATIGNRLLKTQPDYVAPPGHNTHLRVCLTRKEVTYTLVNIGVTIERT